jgi:hypothetical protein
MLNYVPLLILISFSKVMPCHYYTIKNDMPYEMNVSFGECNPFLQTAKKGDLKTLKDLLPNVKNINMQDANGMTALMYAAQNNHVAIIEELLKENSDISLKNKQGKTALDLAKTVLDLADKNKEEEYKNKEEAYNLLLKKHFGWPYKD